MYFITYTTIIFNCYESNILLLLIVYCVLQSFAKFLHNLKNNVRKFLILYFISDRKLILALIVALGIEYVVSYEMI